MEIEEKGKCGFNEENYSGFCEYSMFPNAANSNHLPSTACQGDMSFQGYPQTHMNQSYQQHGSACFWNASPGTQFSWQNQGSNSMTFNSAHSAPLPHPFFGQIAHMEESKNCLNGPQPQAVQGFQPMQQGPLKFVDPNCGMAFVPKPEEKDSDDEFNPNAIQSDDESSEGELAPIDPEEPSKALFTPV